MFQYDDQSEDIILCINCDAEYTITKIDDDQQEPEFCPYCGFHHIEDDYDDEDPDMNGENDKDQYLN